jgi:hypothetical protein
MKFIPAILVSLLLISCSPTHTGNYISNPDINLLGKDESEFPNIDRTFIYKVNGSTSNPLFASHEDGQLKLGRNEIIIYYTYKKDNSPIYQAFIPLVVNFVTNTIYYAQTKLEYPYAKAWIEDHNGKKVTGVVQVPLSVQLPNGTASPVVQAQNLQYNSLQLNAAQPYQFQTVPAANASQPVITQPVVQPFDIGITPTGKLQ